MKNILFTFFFFLLVGTAFGQFSSDRLIASAYSPKKTAAFHFEASECFPKTVADNVQITISTENSQSVKLYILDATQNVIQQEEIYLKKGDNKINYSTAKFNAGAYSIYIQGQKSYLVRKFYVNQ